MIIKEERKREVEEKKGRGEGRGDNLSGKEEKSGREKRKRRK